jgi:phosphopantothenoylcysteine decarboxylase/phosphopantothenate--cysteine ligase
MTRAATHLVQPLSFSTLSGYEAVTSLFPRNPLRGTEHIDLARSANLLLIAPATANCLGKLAAGIADDMLTTVALAATCPILIAPAMNFRMWQHPVVQRNVATLRALGYRFAGPEEGSLACGEEGAGRLASADTIVAAARSLLERGAELAGRRALVTAGRTEEPIDPVRCLTNRASGKMGYALAEAARQRGAEVVLVSGPTSILPPPGVQLVRVRTAEEMKRALLAHLPRSDFLFMAAAVADFRPRTPSAMKTRKDQFGTSLEIERTPDILTAVARKKSTRTTVVGFALETEHHLRNARRKLVEKHLDLVVLNDPTVPGAGFDVDTNVVTVLDRRGGKEAWPLMSKREVADRVVDRAIALSRAGCGGRRA